MSARGFTLIELLVVITIIAFLAVIGMVAFGNAQKQARDARRRVDIDAIANAMEAHYGDTQTGMYSDISPSYFTSLIPQDPLYGQGNKCGKHTDGTPTACQYCFLSDGDLDWKYRGQNEAHNGCLDLSTIDPTNPLARCGDQGVALCKTYILCANLETPSGKPTTDYPNGTQYYCRFSQQ